MKREVNNGHSGGMMRKVETQREKLEAKKRLQGVCPTVWQETAENRHGIDRP